MLSESDAATSAGMPRVTSPPINAAPIPARPLPPKKLPILN